MKPLITTQLIEEYQKEVEIRKTNLHHWQFSYPQETHSTRKQIKEIIMIESFIRSLQSKQSEERQNIVDAFEYGSIKGAKGIEMDGESYLNDNFKIKNK